MDTQLCNGFQTAHMLYFNQSITTLWQVNQARIFLANMLNRLIKFLYLEHEKSAQFVIVP